MFYCSMNQTTSTLLLDELGCINIGKKPSMFFLVMFLIFGSLKSSLNVSMSLMFHVFVV
jgi:hypothetical protein